MLNPNFILVLKLMKTTILARGKLPKIQFSCTRVVPEITLGASPSNVGNSM